MICPFCSYEFDDACGRYGCPNCNGEGLEEKKMENWHTTEMKRLAKLTSDSLRYIANDCREAIVANPDNPKCGQYQDTIHYCFAELRKRETN